MSDCYCYIRSQTFQSALDPEGVLGPWRCLLQFISLQPVSGSQYWLSVSYPFTTSNFFLLYRKFCTTKVLLENGLPDATEDKLPLPGQSRRVYSLDDKIFVDEYLSSCGQRSYSPRIPTDLLQPVSGIIYIYYANKQTFRVAQSGQRLTTGWTVRDRIPVGTRFSAIPARSWGPPRLI